MGCHVLCQFLDELVCQVEDENRGGFDGGWEGGVGVEVWREGYGGEVFDVFVEVVDEVR